MLKKLMVLCIVLYFIPTIVIAYDDEITHRRITERVVAASHIDQYMMGCYWGRPLKGLSREEAPLRQKKQTFFL